MSECILCKATDHVQVTEENGVQLARCPHCNLLFVLHQPSLDELKALYEKDLEDVYVSRAIRFQQKRTVVSAIDLRLIKRYVAKGRLLEIGCAAGYFLQLAARRGYTPLGIEFNSRLVEYAIKTLGLHVLEGTVRRSNLPPGIFDAAYMRDVLSHLDDPKKDLRAIRSLLRDDGYLFLETGNFADLTDKQIRRLQRLHKLQIPDHLFFFSRKSFYKLASLTGFEVVETRMYSTIAYDWVSHVLEDRVRSKLLELSPRHPPQRSLIENLVTTSWYFLRYQLGRALPKTGFPCTVKYVCRAV